jgi:hypothetical protein
MYGNVYEAEKSPRLPITTIPEPFNHAPIRGHPRPTQPIRGKNLF